jgi:hypothetical protein
MSDEPKQISVQVDLAAHIRRMQLPKDIAVVMRENGALTATCNACQVKLQVGKAASGDMRLVWHKCPKCERVSFSIPQNLERDAKIAESMGGVFAYEIYFMKVLPPQLPPPTTWTD